MKGLGQSFLDSQARELAGGIGIQNTDDIQSSIRIPISDSELEGVALGQSASDSIGAIASAIVMVANARKLDLEPSKEIIMGSFSLLVRDGAIDLSPLESFLPRNSQKIFRPTDRIPAGQKHQFKIGSTRVLIKWHSPDLELRNTMRKSNSARVWTAQIKVGNKFLMTNGSWTRKQKSNRTHIPLIRRK